MKSFPPGQTGAAFVFITLARPLNYTTYKECNHVGLNELTSAVGGAIVGPHTGASHVAGAGRDEAGLDVGPVGRAGPVARASRVRHSAVAAADASVEADAVRARPAAGAGPAGVRQGGSSRSSDEEEDDVLHHDDVLL